MSRLNGIMMCCCESTGKSSTPHYVLNIFQCLQWLQPQILQPLQLLVSMPGQCVVLFAPFNLPVTLLHFSLRLLKSTLLALIIESKRAPIVRKRNFLSRCLSGLRRWDSLIQKETHLITSDPRSQLHQLNLHSIISQCGSKPHVESLKLVCCRILVAPQTLCCN